MNVIGWMIVASEIGFWVVIGLGLVTRYIFKRNKLGLFFLALTPLIDFILLVTTSVDLFRGATATTAHAIAAVYIGVSIAFGKSMIEWADIHFQYYITRQVEKPKKRSGLDYAVHYFKGWGRHVLAYVIGAGFLVFLIYFVNDSSRTEALEGVLKLWSIVLGIDFLIAISNFVWPEKAKSG
ncbi:hypothetical protein [Halobacillus campisalis]|uniref:Membrane protein YmcC n=1 Tax=Halobacillus campisalis TaxID=435909 RepID=A0ABW2K082_9BACI|nr:hypothetical protein [Halobacillus campisalis]